MLAISQDYNYGDYRIKPLELNGRNFNGVHYTAQGAWLGDIYEEVIEQDITYQWVKPATINGKRISAPKHWVEKIDSFLSSLDV